MNTQEFLLGLDCLKYGVNITDRKKDNREMGCNNKNHNKYEDMSD